MAEPRIVFLTGATGFIGSRLARRLAAAGDRVRALVRPTTDASELEELGAEVVRGDAADAAALDAGLRGADLAYHLAGYYDLGIVDRASMDRVNVDGTAAFLAAVERAGTKLAVHVSTTLALGPVAEGVGDEATRHPGHGFRSEYERTKYLAHRLAEDAQARGVPVIIACPANVYGPGDPGPNAALLRDVLAGRVPGLIRPSSWWSYVHVDDVADGLVRIGRGGRVGDTYVLSGEHMSTNEFIGLVASHAGRRPPPALLPTRPMRLLAGVLDAISRATGLRFPVTRERVQMGAGWRFLHSSAKAERELGWRARPLAEGLPETVSSLVENHRSRRALLATR